MAASGTPPHPAISRFPPTHPARSPYSAILQFRPRVWRLCTIRPGRNCKIVRG